MKVEIRYKKIFPICIFSCGVFVLIVGLILPQASRHIIIGIISMLLGLGMFFKPTAIVTSVEIEMKNLLGMTLKRHPYDDGELKVTRSGIFINEKKIIGRFICRNEDLDELRNILENNIRKL